MVDILLISLTALLCLIGTLLSTLAFSGTWVVLLAALITFFASDFPSIGTLLVFTLLCIATELIEALAGWLGVQKQGGSTTAGLAAIAGGLLGSVVGSMVFPIIGTFIGMLAGSFAAAFLVEWKRLNHHGDAAKIALGALLARLAVVLLKTVLTLSMSVLLLLGLIQQ